MKSNPFAALVALSCLVLLLTAATTSGQQTTTVLELLDACQQKIPSQLRSELKATAAAVVKSTTSLVDLLRLEKTLKRYQIDLSSCSGLCALFQAPSDVPTSELSVREDETLMEPARFGSLLTLMGIDERNSRILTTRLDLLNLIRSTAANHDSLIELWVTFLAAGM
jgi:hypothetical protein